jgi:hypothetical protein
MSAGVGLICEGEGRPRPLPCQRQLASCRSGWQCVLVSLSLAVLQKRRLQPASVARIGAGAKCQHCQVAGTMAPIAGQGQGMDQLNSRVGRKRSMQPGAHRRCGGASRSAHKTAFKRICDALSAWAEDSTLQLLGSKLWCDVASWEMQLRITYSSHSQASNFWTDSEST